MALNRDRRPAIADRHDRLLDHSFKRVPEGGGVPVAALGGYDKFSRHWIAGTPELHWIVINGIGAAEHFGGGIGGIAGGTDSFQDCLAACFVVTMQDMPSKRNIGCMSIGFQI